MNNGGSNKDRTKGKMYRTSPPRQRFAHGFAHGWFRMVFGCHRE